MAAGAVRSWCRPLRAAQAPCRTLCAASSPAAPGSATESVSAASVARPPRFYVPSRLAVAAPGAVLRLPPEESRHATKTLRLRQGDRLELCDGRGWLALAEIAEVDRSGAVVHTVEAPLQVPRSGWQWEVACACGSLKGGRSDWLVEKCTELGAAAFTPLLTQRSPVIGSGADEERPVASTRRPGRRRGGSSAAGSEDDDSMQAAGGREGRWARVATAAMKQCLRPHAMTLEPPCSVRQLCERIGSADVALVGVAGAPPLHAVAAQLSVASGGATAGQLRGILCIGPEGDWTSNELAALVAAGARPVGLGDLRLRAETAAVALLSYLRMHLPD